MDYRPTSLIFPAVSSSFDTVHAEATSPTSLSLQDLITFPAKAEHVLDRLSTDQIALIEQTIDRVKRRKMEPTPRVSPPPPPHSIQKVKAPLSPIADAYPATETISSAASLAATLPPAMTHPSPPATPSYKASLPNQREPLTEVRGGVEWVSFVYSHNRAVRRYSIRTDIHTVSLAAIGVDFKNDNCVYPRANLPKETYRGNRWGYETECNVLGWKLAWLNREITGKRGLVQRAVDSYRNRYPNMRSRRVARQEKLLNGTLRKRKHRAESDTEPTTHPLAVAAGKATQNPKTITIDDATAPGRRLRIKIDVESVDLQEISDEFRRQNCAFPRALDNAKSNQSPSCRSRWHEEAMCNELGWKLVWLNQRTLANKQNRLQRALDVYRTKFMPELQPRKHSKRPSQSPTVPLTQSALSEQNARFAQLDDQPSSSAAASVVSGTTESFDFDDCLSLAHSEHGFEDFTALLDTKDVSLSPTTAGCTTTLSSSSSSSNTSAACTPSPSSFAMLGVDIHDSFTLPPMMDDSFSTFDLPSSAAEDMMKIYDPAPPTSAMGDGSNEFESMTLF